MIYLVLEVHSFLPMSGIAVSLERFKYPWACGCGTLRCLRTQFENSGSKNCCSVSGKQFLGEKNIRLSHLILLNSVDVNKLYKELIIFF